MEHLRPSARKKTDETTAEQSAKAQEQITLKPYQRPELTPEEKELAAENAEKLIRKYGYTNLVKMLGMLALENARLVKEIQEHRAARGFEPLPTFKV